MAWVRFKGQFQGKSTVIEAFFLKIKDSLADAGFGQVGPRKSLQNFRWLVWAITMQSQVAWNIKSASNANEMPAPMN